MKIAGLATVTIDGVSSDAPSDWTFTYNPEQRTSIMSCNGESHFGVEQVASTMKGSLHMRDTLDPTSLHTKENSVIQLGFENGHVGMLRAAYFSGGGEISAKDGHMSCEFTGIGSYLR